MKREPSPLFSQLFSSLMFGDFMGGLIVFCAFCVYLMSWWWIPITFALWIFLLSFAAFGDTFFWYLVEKWNGVVYDRRVGDEPESEVDREDGPRPTN